MSNKSFKDEIFNDPLLWSSEGKSIELFEEYDEEKYLKSEIYRKKELSSLNEYEFLDCFLESAEFGRIERIREMLQSPKRTSLLSFRDNDGYTALHRASYNGHIDVVKFLIEQGSDINAPTIDGWTPLHCACKWEKINVVRLLLEYDADINAKSISGLTPLHVAALNRRHDIIIKILLNDPKIKYEARNKLGYRAEDIARQMGAFYDTFKGFKNKQK